MIMDEIAAFFIYYYVCIPEYPEVLGHSRRSDIKRFCQSIYTKRTLLEEMNHADPCFHRQYFIYSGKLFFVHYTTPLHLSLCVYNIQYAQSLVKWYDYTGIVFQVKLYRHMPPIEKTR